jgi:hypothetical protein
LLKENGLQLDKQKKAISYPPALREDNRGFCEIYVSSDKEWSILAAKIPASKVQGAAQDLAILNQLQNQTSVTEILAVPKCEFGDLVTYDRKEIETLNSLCLLFEEYFKTDGQQSTPISIAIFGRPGSGKSFAVKEIAKSLEKKLAGRKLQFHEYNLSQFESPAHLTPVFHLIRDNHLEKKMPIVFFDEFDSPFAGTPLFWLKHFLAPMQDGKFLENGAYHPIGRAVFVFAGGVAERFEQFSEGLPLQSSQSFGGFFGKEAVDVNLAIDLETAKKNAKLPDFLSRLRGFLDVPNIDFKGCPDEEPAVMLRRALVIRSSLKRRAPDVFEQELTKGDIRLKKLDISPRLLLALLTLPAFKHGARSLQALLSNSLLNGADRFDPGRLPPLDQLVMHVKPDDFESAMRCLDPRQRH